MANYGNILYGYGETYLTSPLRPFDPCCDEAHDPYICNDDPHIGDRLCTTLVPGKDGPVICRLPKDVVDYHGEPHRDYDDDGEFCGWVWPTKTVPGKICLITKDSNACCGEAMVTIVAVKNTCCIGKAEMIQHQAPSNEEILKRLMDRWNGSNSRYGGEGYWFNRHFGAGYQSFADYEISFHTNGKCGSYVVIKEIGMVSRRAMVLDGLPYLTETPACMGYDGATVETYNLESWILLQKFGKTADELLDGLVEFNFETTREDINCTSLLKWLTPEEQELFDKAAGIEKKNTRRYWWSERKATLIQFREFAHVPFALVGNLCEVMNDFTADEIAKVVTMVSKLNTKANEEIMNKVRKGTLPKPRKNKHGFFVFD